MPTILDLCEYANDGDAQAAYVTDDEEAVKVNFETGEDTWAGIGDFEGSDYWTAVKIVVSAEIICSGVSIYLITRVGNPSGDVTFRLETDDGGEPSGSLIHASATYAMASPTDNAWNRVPFAPFTLAVGTYWLVASMPAQDNNNYFKWTADSNGGIDSRGYTSDEGANWIIDNHAPYFRLYGLHLQCYSEDTIKQEGSYSLKVIAKGTDSLNDTLTRTIGSPIDIKDRDRIKFWIYASRTGSNIKVGIRDSGTTVTEYTPNIAQVNTWQEEKWYIGNPKVVNADKDAIDRIIITIIEASQDNTFYIDNMQAYGLAKAIMI